MSKKVICLLFGAFMFLCVSSVTYAADTEVLLDSIDSTSGFTVKDSSGNEILRISGDGKVTLVGGNVVTAADGSGTGSANTFLGDSAGSSNTTGYKNTAVGSKALSSNTDGIHNTATGYAALSSNTTGIQNTANGRKALFHNISGHSNVAIGDAAMHLNTTGRWNTAIGVTALYANTTQGANTALGWAALKANTGSSNTAVGHGALRNNDTGGDNVAIGIGALMSNVDGHRNVAVGRQAGVDATGTGNVFLGYKAGINHTTDNYMLYIGFGSWNLISGDFQNNRVGIGISDPSTLTHPLEMGNANGAHVTAGGAWTNASSRDYKENIENLSVDNALETLEGLKPVTFKYKTDESEKYVGFIAEDVPELVATRDRKGLSPMDITAVLTKVVQEQQKIISELSAKVKSLEDRI